MYSEVSQLACQLAGASASVPDMPAPRSAAALLKGTPSRSLTLALVTETAVERTLLCYPSSYAHARL
jgi:hypothetical protein